MAEVKITQLSSAYFNANTANTVFLVVDLPTDITGQMTGTSLAKGLYSNNPLNVGNNQILFANTIAQFSGNSNTYMQLNIQNFQSNGSSDVVLTSDTGTNANNYVDLGINNSTFNDPNYSAMGALDGYLYVAGPNAGSNQANLMIGTASYGANINFVAGGTTVNDIVAVFNEDVITFNEPTIINQIPSDPHEASYVALQINNYGNGYSFVVNDDVNDYSPFAIDQSGNVSIGAVSANGYKLLVVGNTYISGNVLTGNNFVLSDGSFAASNNYVNANDASTLTSAKNYTNSANLWLQANDSLTLVTAQAFSNSANLWLQANDVLTLATAKNYANSANLWLQANDVLTLSTAQAYTNAANLFAQNTYIAKSNNLTFNNVVITGNLFANTVGTSVSVDSITSNNATFSKNITVLGTLTCNTAQGNVFFANITTITSQANTIQWVSQQTSPPQSYGQIWFSANDVSLVEDTDVTNDRPLIGKVLYEKVYNGSGTTIAANSWVRLAGAVTNTAIPYVVLADAGNAANSFVSGFVKNSIANNAYGYIYTQGIVNNLNSSTYNVGDILFLSTTPGASQNTPPTGANVVIQLAKVLSNSATMGKLQVNILPQPAWGKPSGSIIYSSNNILVSSNTITINDSTQTLNLSGSIVMSGSVTMNNSTFFANSAAVSIIGSANGAIQAPSADGTMLQITGKDGVNSKVITDAAGAGVYALYNGRSMRGTAQTPTASLAGDVLVRFGGTGYGTTGFGLLSGGAKMDYIALENYTDTTKGTQILLATTPVGSNALVNVVTYAANSAAYSPNTALFVANTIHYNANYNNANVAQTGTKATAVYANGRTGQITTVNTNINKGAATYFVMYNTYITSSKDVVILNISNGASVNYALSVNNVVPGSCNVVINNCDGTPSGSNAADTLTINFAIINVT